jgi:hypothetical protein
LLHLAGGSRLVRGGQGDGQHPLLDIVRSRHED